MELITLSGPPQSLALQIFEAQRIATPSMTYRELCELWPKLWAENTGGGKMSGWLSDIGHVVNTGIRATGSAVGAGGITSAITGLLDSAGHSIEDNIGNNISNDAKTGIASYLGLSTAGAFNSKSIIMIIVALVVLYLLFFRGRR